MERGLACVCVYGWDTLLLGKFVVMVMIRVGVYVEIKCKPNGNSFDLEFR